MLKRWWLFTLCFLPACTEPLEFSEKAADFQNTPTAVSTPTESPTSSDSMATFVLFQNSYNTNLKNRDGSNNTQAGGTNFLYSIGVYADPNDGNKKKLLVNDRLNFRVLIFNELPDSGDAVPDVVVGQPDMTSGTVNAGLGVVNAQGFAGAKHMTVCPNGMLFVADSGAHRVMGYNQIPTSNGTPADFVLGQNAFSGNTSGTTATTMNTPYSVTCNDNKLYVTDRGNERILVYDPIPTTTGAAASYVIGQPDLTTKLAAACNATQLKTPYEVQFHNNKMYVSDGYNHRVLVFDPIPTASGAAATTVLGQANLTSCLMNRTNTLVPAQNSMYAPNALGFIGNTHLVVADNLNNRVTFFKLPVQTGDLPVALLGQNDYTSATIVNPPTENSFTNPKGFYIDSKRVWIGDNNNRVLVKLIPTLP